ncbi:MAG: vWA domain-containing protein [Planctomycetota bacterium]|jgi:Ca-activated chloride channel family protein
MRRSSARSNRITLIASLLLLLASTACQASRPPTPDASHAPTAAPESPEARAEADPADPAARPAAQPLQIATPAPKAAATTPKNGAAVFVQVLPQFHTLHAPGAGPHDLNVLIRMTAKGEAPTDRPPLDLGLVIDRSGSMSGDKIRSVKQAALELLGQLGPRDRVTLVSYSDSVHTHMTAVPVDESGRARLRQSILDIRDGGRTALGPALFTTLDRMEPLERGPETIAHVMLLSDGLANVGETNPAIIAARAAAAFRKGVTVSTLGVGLDYNEDLMTRVADQGGGRYHFIEDGPAVVKVVNDELAGVVATIARNVELIWQPGQGVALSRVFGYPSEEAPEGHRIRIGSLAQGQTREVIVRLAVPSRPEVALGGFTARWKDVLADGAPRDASASATVATTADAAAAAKTEQTEVTIRVAEVESSAQLEIAARATDSGDFDAARDALRNTLGSLRQQQAATPSPKLEAQIREFEDAEEEIDEARTSNRARKAYVKKRKSKAYQSFKK